jgi:DNA invertase Pin-like site-specific DNA recombinase
MSTIQPHHLQRQAYVYLRQSTPSQGDTHRASTERQYALVDRAMMLGWDRSQIRLLDHDLGKSGTTAQGRDDFHQLMAAVGLGEVGAVFALEASRFSRSQADWHKLLDICALTDTFVVDHDGIYNPNDFNDRVILGFKGTWSHTELHALRLRLHGAKLHKAHKGELRCNPPTGYVYDPSGVLVLDPDESVVAAIHLLFQQFAVLGSAYGVMRYFAQHQIPFPRRRWMPGTSGALHWGPLGLSRVIAILHNPTYAGAYVYGRRHSQPVVLEGQRTRVRTVPRPREQWTVCRQQAHAAYISWETYVANCQQLTRNRPDLESVGSRGMPRQGAALLQGLLLCGRCGRRMTVRYYGTGGRYAVYQCARRHLHDGQGGICWTVPAGPLDASVEAHVLAALTQDNLELALAVLTQMEEDAHGLDRHWQAQLERARYAVQRAERQYDAVEPENRLVARALERRWNEQLQHLQEVERAYAEARRTQRLEVSPEERYQILRLAADLPTVWRAATTTQADRKRLLGLLVKQVALTPLDTVPRQTQVQVLWHTEATTTLTVARPSRHERTRTPSDVIRTITTLAPTHTDAAIAALLNARGVQSGKGHAFTVAAVVWVRRKYGITKPLLDPRQAACLEARPDGRYSTRALAIQLGVPIHTIHYWRKHGMLPAIQETPGGPWWHEVTPAILESLQRQIRQAPKNIAAQESESVEEKSAL